MISSLFCKKRKSPQPTHSSSPPKETSRAQAAISSNDNGKRISKPSGPDEGESNDRLKASNQPQVMLDSDEDVSLSEKKNSERSVNLNGETSATTVSSIKKGEQDVQTKGEKREKARKLKPNVENFMQGEGLQPVVRKQRNDESAQKENRKEKSQERGEQEKHKENNVVEATNVEVVDEGEFSDELSYQDSSSASDSLAEFDEISQVESEYVSIEDRISLESSEGGDIRKIGVTREGRMQSGVKNVKRTERTQAEALEELRKFPLRELKMTEGKLFDTRRTFTKKYLALCEEAGQDAKSYYYNEIYKSEKQGIDGDKKESSLEKTGRDEDDDGSEAALRELKKFPLKELKITKDKLFDKRFTLTKIYLDLCEKAKKDPEQYYKENLK